MPYIESHLTLGRHPKLKRLARTLKVSYPTAVGHLQYLWWWAFEFAEDGQLTKFTSEEIATEAMWEGDAELFRHALTDAGFINEDGSLHDWGDYTRHFFEQKEANRRRQQAWRERQKQKEEEERNALHNGYVTPSRNSDITVESRATLPNLTLPNLTSPDPNLTVPEPLKKPSRKDKPPRANGGQAASGPSPYDIFQSLCDESGTDASTVPKVAKNAALRFCKEMLVCHYTGDQILGCYRYLRKERWRTEPVEAVTIAKKIAGWVAMGQPAEPADDKQKTTTGGITRDGGMQPRDYTGGEYGQYVRKIGG